VRLDNEGNQAHEEREVLMVHQGQMVNVENEGLLDWQDLLDQEVTEVHLDPLVQEEHLVHKDPQVRKEKLDRRDHLEREVQLGH